MKIEIRTDSGTKEVEMQSPKGKHIKQVWKFLSQIGPDNVTSVNEYLIFLDNLAAELSGLSVEELDELDIAEKEKITGIIQQKALDTVNFTKLSSSQGS